MTFDPQFPMNATDATDVAAAQPLWMGVLGVCLGITGSFFSTLSLLIIKWSAKRGIVLSTYLVASGGSVTATRRHTARGRSY